MLSSLPRDLLYSIFPIAFPYSINKCNLTQGCPFFVNIFITEMDPNPEPQKPQDNPPTDPQLPDYKFLKTLGSGTFGKVKSAIHIPTG